MTHRNSHQREKRKESDPHPTGRRNSLKNVQHYYLAGGPISMHFTNNSPQDVHTGDIDEFPRYRRETFPRETYSRPETYQRRTSYQSRTGYQRRTTYETYRPKQSYQPRDIPDQQESKLTTLNETWPDIEDSHRQFIENHQKRRCPSPGNKIETQLRSSEAIKPTEQRESQVPQAQVTITEEIPRRRLSLVDPHCRSLLVERLNMFHFGTLQINPLMSEVNSAKTEIVV